MLPRVGRPPRGQMSAVNVVGEITLMIARKCGAGLVWHVGVDEIHERGLHLREVERDGLVAEDAAAVSDPATGVKIPKP